MLAPALEIERDVSEFVQLRQDIHQHPELAFEEYRTSDLVAERLTAWGYQVKRGLGGTGVVGQLRRGEGTKCLGLRADMDALPIEEKTGLPHASLHAGKMHACGHDGHTAMLLAAAKHLAEQGDFNGTLNLIFQPAEEGFGGAKKMMEEGLFEQFPCDAIFAMHNMPGFKAGQLLFRKGPTMASSENITITLHGKGGHGAMPHHTADPIVAGASIVMGLQTIVSRNVAPLQTAVITVGSFKSGQANNVIPQTATLELSVRSLDREVRQLLNERIETLVHSQAHSYCLRAEVAFHGGYPVLVNTSAETEFATQVALELLGPDRVEVNAQPLTGSEDFAFMLERVPGSYLLIGNSDGSDPLNEQAPNGFHGACMVHNPSYDFNDHNIGVGSAYWIRLTERFLV